MERIRSLLINKLKDPLFYTGLLTLAFYLRYLYLNLYTDYSFDYLLWYSSLGLLLLSLALLSKNYLLISVAFCSLFVIEGVWFLNFFLTMFFDLSIGNKTYAFIPGSRDFDLIGSLYHLLLAPFSLLGALLINRVSKYAWIYSSLGALALGIGTYLFIDNSRGENINCVFESCENLFSPIYLVTNPLRIILGTLLLGLLVFLPSNYLILLLKSHSQDNSNPPSTTI